MNVNLSEKQIELIWNQFDIYFIDTGQYFEDASEFIENKESLELLTALYKSAPHVIENTYTSMKNMLEHVRRSAQQSDKSH